MFLIIALEHYFYIRLICFYYGRNLDFSSFILVTYVYSLTQNIYVIVDLTLDNQHDREGIYF